MLFLEGGQVGGAVDVLDQWTHGIAIVNRLLNGRTEGSGAWFWCRILKNAEVVGAAVVARAP